MFKKGEVCRKAINHAINGMAKFFKHKSPCPRVTGLTKNPCTQGAENKKRKLLRDFGDVAFEASDKINPVFAVAFGFIECVIGLYENFFGSAAVARETGEAAAYA